MKFNGICLITESVPALVQFYSRVFCMDAVGDDTHAEFPLDGIGIAIFSKQGMEEMAPGSTQNYGTGSVTIMIQVADVDAEYERIKALDVEFVKPPQTHPWGARAFWFRDPDGNIVDFFGRVEE